MVADPMPSTELAGAPSGYIPEGDVAERRRQVLAVIDAALVDMPEALAAWEGGSVATGRADAWSDIDLVILAADGAAQKVLAAVEAATVGFGPVVNAYAVPEPAWHGGSQRFWQLAGLGPHLMLDVVVLGLEAPERFLAPERHGRAVLRFDRGGHTALPPFDVDSHVQAMQRAHADARARFAIFQALVEKEIRRGHLLDALGFYQGLTLRPLVQVLGMLHRPLTWDFGHRYLHGDLPRDVAARLADLHLVGGLEELAAKHPLAVAWFQELAALPLPDAAAIARQSALLRADPPPRAPARP